MAEEVYESNLNLADICDSLTAWFEAEGRKLPWRTDKTPYRVWISEIMLQQTRVEAVKPYYARFMERLPDVKALADISQEELNKLWEGLGYYSRARNLKKAAQTIVQEYGGEMPADYNKLLSLSGIGSYTAGAVASFAFQIPVAAVDGNVLRVMTRLMGSVRDISLPQTKKYFEDYIGAFLKTGRCMPDAFNAAIMELGAIVCVPNGEPLCAKCPLEAVCVSRLNGLTDKIPVKAAKKERRIEKRTVFLVIADDRILIEKRPAKGILAGLYQFPNVEGYQTKEMVTQMLFQKADTERIVDIMQGPQAKHIFSHIEWHMKSYIIHLCGIEAMRLCNERLTAGMGRFVNKQELLQEVAIPSAFSVFVNYISDNPNIL